MGLSDGSRVRGDGYLIAQDGTTTRMTEGETITKPAVRVSW
jgi:hypothetical protein